jgi:hypothetical protein
MRRDDVPLYEITESGLRQHAAAGFAALGLYERLTCSGCSARASVWSVRALTASLTERASPWR